MPSGQSQLLSGATALLFGTNTISLRFYHKPEEYTRIFCRLNMGTSLGLRPSGGYEGKNLSLLAEIAFYHINLVKTMCLLAPVRDPKSNISQREVNCPTLHYIILHFHHICTVIFIHNFLFYQSLQLRNAQLKLGLLEFCLNQAQKTGFPP